MPSSRISTSSPAPPADRLVVCLNKVLLNSKDPRAEMDGVAELVIKGERQILPGVSWTENLSGTYPMSQIMTVLCGNHTLEIIDLSLFAREAAKDALCWRVERGFCHLTFEYPLRGSKRDSIREASSVPETSSQPASTHQRLQLTFADHEGFLRTASALEKLGLLRPPAQTSRPRTVQPHLGLGWPRICHSPRPSPSQSMGRPLSQRPRSGNDRSHSSSPLSLHSHSSNLAAMVPQGVSRPARARSLPQAPPTPATSRLPINSMQYRVHPLGQGATTSPFFQSHTVPQADASQLCGVGPVSPLVRPEGDGHVPSPRRFLPPRRSGQPQHQTLARYSRQQGLRKSPKRAGKNASPSPLQPRIEERLLAASGAARQLDAALPRKPPRFAQGTESRFDERTGTDPREFIDSPGDDGSATADAQATGPLSSSAAHPFFYSSLTRLFGLYQEKYDAAVKAAGDDEEARRRVLHDTCHEFSLSWITLCGNAQL